MRDLAEEVAEIDANTLSKLITAIIRRHGELFPNWQLEVASLPKKETRNEMIDATIEFLQKLKHWKSPDSSDNERNF